MRLRLKHRSALITTTVELDAAGHPQQPETEPDVLLLRLVSSLDLPLGNYGRATFATYLAEARIPLFEVSGKAARNKMSKTGLKAETNIAGNSTLSMQAHDGGQASDDVSSGSATAESRSRSPFSSPALSASPVLAQIRCVPEAQERTSRPYSSTLHAESTSKETKDTGIKTASEKSSDELNNERRASTAPLPGSATQNELRHSSEASQHEKPLEKRRASFNNIEEPVTHVQSPDASVQDGRNSTVLYSTASTNPDERSDGGVRTDKSERLEEMPENVMEPSEFDLDPRLFQCKTCTKTAEWEAPCGDVLCEDCKAKLFQRVAQEESPIFLGCCGKLLAPETIADEEDSAKKPLAEFECVACEKPSAMMNSCGHTYCKSCIVKLFTEALKDSTRFPTRCCRVKIPLTSVRELLGANLAEKVEAKEIEFGTPDLVYCSNTKCGKVIPAKDIKNNEAFCGGCLHRTCVLCRTKMHSGDCAHDEEKVAVLSAAREHGWQSCAKCQALVELSSGCNHITCRCGYHFCHLCGVKWKTCRCVRSSV